MNPTRHTGSYFSVLDGIRGIAAILVMIRHMPDLFGIDFTESFLAVDLFFTLSGVVIANAYEQRIRSGELGACRFMWLRWARIYPLYVAGTVIGIMGVCSGMSFTGDFPVAVGLSLLILPYFGHWGLFQFNGAAWSLFFELVANAIYAVFFRILTVRVLQRIVLTSALGLIAIRLLFFIDLDVGWSRPSFVFGFLRVGFSFFTGVLLYRKFSSSTENPKLRESSNLIAVGILVTLIIALTAPLPYWAPPFFELLTIFVVFPTAIYIALQLQPSLAFSKFFRLLGTISYGIYTLHWPVNAFIRVVLARHASSDYAHVVSSFAPWIGIGFVVGLAVLSVLADKLYDRPVRGLMLKLVAKPDRHLRISSVPPMP